MAFHYRNLLNESIEDSITSFCAPYCQPEKNQLGLCPLTCISFCYPTCHRPFLAAIPPPLSDYPATTTATTTAFDGHRNPDHGQYTSSRFFAMSLAVLVVGFFFFFCYAVCRFCSAWLNSRNEGSEVYPREEESRGGEFLDQDLDRRDQVYHPIWYIRSVGLQPSVISSITILKYKKGDGLVEGTTCAVCLNEFQEDETVRLLPKCDHAFHIPCIDKWLESHTNCPICRADIVVNPVVSPSPVQNVENPGASQEEIHEGNNPGNVENPGALEKIQEGVSGNAEIPGALEKIQAGVQGNVGNPGDLEKIQEGAPESGPELELEKDSESCKSSVEDASEGKSRQDSREKLGNGDSKEVTGVLQPLRRSVSCNPLSASDNPPQSDEQVNIESFPSIAEKNMQKII